MKLNKLMFPLLASSLFLVGCNTPIDDKGDEPSGEDTPADSLVDYGKVDFDKEDAIQEGGSFGEWFVEIYYGRNLASDGEYLFSFASSYKADTSYTINISNEKLATAEKGDNNTFTISTKHAIGQFILKIYNAQNAICYRDVITVKKGYSKDEIVEASYNVDIFKTPTLFTAIYGNFTMSVISTSPYSAVLTGGDDMEAGITISFDSEFDSFDEDRDGYWFQSTETSSTSSQKTTTVGGFLITRPCEAIYVYEQSGYLLSILYAQE